MSRLDVLRASTFNNAKVAWIILIRLRRNSLKTKLIWLGSSRRLYSCLGCTNGI